MIYGIGTDIVLINRIKNTEAFAKKILSSDELFIWQDYSSTKQQSFLAKQFACKEATAKALGTGFRYNVYPRDIEILRNDLGKPYINPQGSLKNIFSDLKEFDMNLDDIEISDQIQIKARNDIYYELYKEARKKARVSRNLALQSYLEAKEIKTKYDLDDIESDEDDQFFNSVLQSEESR